MYYRRVQVTNLMWFITRFTQRPFGGAFFMFWINRC
jgi:hypothetical protein